MSWWRQTGSNRRPIACKAIALPTELCPRINTHLPLKAALAISARMVGLGRFELPTSRLSGVRSNQLSYRPLAMCAWPLNQWLRRKVPMNRAGSRDPKGPRNAHPIERETKTATSRYFLISSLPVKATYGSMFLRFLMDGLAKPGTSKEIP
jgi:hypothetical protein